MRRAIKDNKYDAVDWSIIILLAVIITFELFILTKLEILSCIKKWSYIHSIVGFIVILIILSVLLRINKISSFIKQLHFTDWLIFVTFFILINLSIVLFIIVKHDDKIPNIDCLPSILGNLAITNNSKCDIGVAIERLGFAIGGVIALLVALASLRRVKALDETADAQNKIAEAEEQGNIEDRYKNATGQLGNDKSSVRLAGAYSLYHLAIDNKERSKNICDVLCVYIRDITASKSKTSKSMTSRNYLKTKTSNEVQIILNLLTKIQDEQ